MPKLSKCLPALSKAVLMLAWLAFGTCWVISVSALSMKTPEASPNLSFKISPPAGERVSADRYQQFHGF